uniref:Glycosyltransferase family 1 protein n=1 Tax=Anaerolinea thermolimosa TaxID=229919 RepID=A0A7C4PUG0_9CHLR
MKIAHWTMKNGSGMHRAAEDMAWGERALGADSLCLDCFDPRDLPRALDADVQVVHTHLPEPIDEMKSRVVWVAHGTPEHVFGMAVLKGTELGHGAPDSWMSAMYRLQTSDAVVTFWPRHRDIWQSLMDKGRTVHLVPMGIDLDFWKPVPSRGKFAGTPSILTAENCHQVKWPLDLFICFPWVADRVPSARLHAFYLPLDQNRWWFPLIDRNRAAYRSFVNPASLAHEDLRNAFVSSDFYVGLVRYGDHNRICLEARACGCKVISYAGNPYADYWIPEGDQRVMAEKLARILLGEEKPRDPEPAPSRLKMAAEMLALYEDLL